MLSGSPNLKHLDLFGCTSLVEVDASVGFLPKLVSLDLDWCSNLQIFPTRISLKSLRRFCLKGCVRLQTFPEIEDKMEFITELELRGSGISELPPSISYLTGLEKLNTTLCNNMSIRSISTSQANSNISQDNCSSLFPNLRSLLMVGCKLSKSDFLMDLDCSSTLGTLDLSRNNFVSLPASIIKFVNLEILLLYHCAKLREIPELPPKVRQVNAADCRALEIFPKLSSIFGHRSESQGLERLYLINCDKLCANNGYDLERIEVLLLNQHSYPFEIIVPGSEVPKWFNYRCEEDQDWLLLPGIFNSIVICEVSIKIPRNIEWNKSGLVVCVVFEVCASKISLHVKIRINGVHRYMHIQSCPIHWPDSSHVWLKYIPLALTYKPHVDGESLLQYDTCEVVIFSYRGDSSESPLLSVKSYGVHLVCHQIRDVLATNDIDDDGDTETEQWFPSSSKPMNPQQKRPPGASAVMGVDDTNHADDSDSADIDVDDSDANDHEEGQWFSLSSEAMTPRTLDLLSFLKPPVASSVLKEVDDTNVINPQEEWLSLSLAPTGIQQRPHGVIVMATNDSDIDDDGDTEKEQWFPSSLKPMNPQQKRPPGASAVMGVDDTSQADDSDSADIDVDDTSQADDSDSADIDVDDTRQADDSDSADIDVDDSDGSDSADIDVDDSDDRDSADIDVDDSDDSDSADIDVDDIDHEEEQWFSLSSEPMTTRTLDLLSFLKLPAASSVLKEEDETNVINPQDEWLALSLAPTGIQQGPHGVNVMAFDDSNIGHGHEEENWLSLSLRPTSSLISPLQPSILMADGDTSINYDHEEAPLGFLSLELTSLHESDAAGISAVMEVGDTSSGYDHQEAQWLSLSLGPTSLQKIPPKPSVSLTVHDTNIDYDDHREAQWLSSSLEQSSLLKNPSEASLFTVLDDTNILNDHDPQEEPTFSGLCDCCRIQ
ncbi:uncharacterized protein LOC121049169 [Rosa chinensis]|uniref:uncharacterized protein LOC121049169 n=1 Tax=Rosa chinensis TaxID=74649 RepID=UPI001AD91CC8|nr:uncharacterized protein LOC121049169 [Rosa chinensis]